MPLLVHDLQVLLHDQRRLHQQTAHPDGIRLVLVGGVQHRLDRDT